MEEEGEGGGEEKGEEGKGGGRRGEVVPPRNI